MPWLQSQIRPDQGLEDVRFGGPQVWKGDVREYIGLEECSELVTFHHLVDLNLIYIFELPSIWLEFSYQDSVGTWVLLRFND